MEGLLRHGSGGAGGGGVIACGSVESYPCGPLLECVYLHRFLRIKKRTTRYLRCFCMFSEGFFSGRSNPMVLHYYLHLLTAPARCVCVCFAHQEPKSMAFTVCWLVFRRRFSTRSFELRYLYFMSRVGMLL